MEDLICVREGFYFFYYDLENKDSFKGRPTINLLQNSLFFGRVEW